ncbi:class II aldolase/adducin family protein [Rhizomonospora bruguierae]|uniref:class II aldolase/adducin family protein n=1 Tax=Rhizomonospora bruguierae TaxID=1581705 RepID=UPI001BCD5C0E|nr:class II aldolase/adducin family protein [Micromonospora sp. NBRC 107566]
MTHAGGDLRDRLARVGHDVAGAGLVVASGGNLSAREPGGDECWVTATGTWFDRLDRESFVRVRLRDGAVLDRASPTSELALHLATYRVRPDVNAIVHLHPQTVVLLAALGERIRLVTTDHAHYVRRVAVAPFHPPGTPELATAADAVADGTDCVVLAHHGVSVLGETVEWAHRRARNLEEAARLTYRALALGRLDTLPECPGFTPGHPLV